MWPVRRRMAMTADLPAALAGRQRSPWQVNSRVRQATYCALVLRTSVATSAHLRCGRKFSPPGAGPRCLEPSRRPPAPANRTCRKLGRWSPSPAPASPRPSQTASAAGSTSPTLATFPPAGVAGPASATPASPPAVRRRHLLPGPAGTPGRPAGPHLLRPARHRHRPGLVRPGRAMNKQIPPASVHRMRSATTRASPTSPTRTATPGCCRRSAIAQLPIGTDYYRRGGS